MRIPTIGDKNFSGIYTFDGKTVYGSYQDTDFNTNKSYLNTDSNYLPTSYLRATNGAYIYTKHKITSNKLYFLCTFNTLQSQTNPQYLFGCDTVKVYFLNSYLYVQFKNQTPIKLTDQISLVANHTFELTINGSAATALIDGTYSTYLTAPNSLISQFNIGIFTAPDSTGKYSDNASSTISMSHFSFYDNTEFKINAISSQYGVSPYVYGMFDLVTRTLLISSIPFTVSGTGTNDRYILTEYIDYNGNGMVDTEYRYYNLDNSLQINCDFEFNNLSTNQSYSLFGCMADATQGGIAFNGSYDGSTVQVRDSFFPLVFVPPAYIAHEDTEYVVEITIDGNNYTRRYFKPDERETQSDVYQYTITQKKPFLQTLYLGGINGGGYGAYPLKGKIYGFTVLENGIPKVMMKPARKESSDVVGFYDTVRCKFYEAENLSAGPIVKTDIEQGAYNIVAVDDSTLLHQISGIYIVESDGSILSIAQMHNLTWCGWTRFETRPGYGTVKSLGSASDKANITVGGVVYKSCPRAYGQYQFDYRYGLVGFLEICTRYNPTRYAVFVPYIKNTSKIVTEHEQFTTDFKYFAENFTDEFRMLQDVYYYQKYHKPVMTLAKSVFNLPYLDDPYMAGTLGSFAIRDGAYAQSWCGVSMKAMQDAFAIDNTLTVKELLKIGYAKMDSKYSPLHDYRWSVTKSGPSYQYWQCMADMDSESNCYYITTDDDLNEMIAGEGK